MTRRLLSRQDTGGLALRLTPGQSIEEMSHFQRQNEDGFRSQATLFSLRHTGGPQQKPFAIQCISEMVQMPKKKKQKIWKMARILGEYSAESCSPAVGDTDAFLLSGSVLLSQYSASGGLSFIRHGYLCSVNQIL